MSMWTEPMRTGTMIWKDKRLPVTHVMKGGYGSRDGWYATTDSDNPLLRVQMFYPSDMFKFEEATPAVPVQGETDEAPIITLCGSSKFKDAVNAENARLTTEGNVVISLGLFGHADLPDYDWERDTSELKRKLDDLHFQKIRMADRIHVVDVDGYTGESTKREIAYAESLGKPVTYMSRSLTSTEGGTPDV